LAISAPPPSTPSLHDALPILTALLASAALPALAQQQLTVVNFGGANANAQKKAFYEPFEKSGVKVVPVEYNGEQAKIKAMVETRSEEHTSELQSRENLVCRLL